MSLTHVEPIAVLFGRRDSIYKDLGAETWDYDRDAKNWPRGSPLIAHPPCRAWGRLKNLAQPRPGEKELALWAVSVIRNDGGVLEHPHGSTLWRDAGLPSVGGRDIFGGFTLEVMQWWWGHKALKPTWLYVCGIDPENVPPYPPIPYGRPTYVVQQAHRKGHPEWLPELSKTDRERTPAGFALWLLELASRCRPPRVP